MINKWKLNVGAENDGEGTLRGVADRYWAFNFSNDWTNVLKLTSKIKTLLPSRETKWQMKYIAEYVHTVRAVRAIYRPTTNTAAATLCAAYALLYAMICLIYAL